MKFLQQFHSYWQNCKEEEIQFPYLLCEEERVQQVRQLVKQLIICRLCPLVTHASIGQLRLTALGLSQQCFVLYCNPALSVLIRLRIESQVISSRGYIILSTALCQRLTPLPVRRSMACKQPDGRQYQSIISVSVFDSLVNQAYLRPRVRLSP